VKGIKLCLACFNNLQKTRQLRKKKETKKKKKNPKKEAKKTLDFPVAILSNSRFKLWASVSTKMSFFFLDLFLAGGGGRACSAEENCLSSGVNISAADETIVCLFNEGAFVVVGESIISSNDQDQPKEDHDDITNKYDPLYNRKIVNLLFFFLCRVYMKACP
jgi:hypothetical protein